MPRQSRFAIPSSSSLCDSLKSHRYVLFQARQAAVSVLGVIASVCV